MGSWGQRRDHPQWREEGKEQGETLGSQLEGASGSAQMSVLGDSNTQEDAMSGPCRLRAQVLLHIPATPKALAGQKAASQVTSEPSAQSSAIHNCKVLLEGLGI